MQHAHRKTVVVSAPGKVLLAGGYLVLDRPHPGSVLALDARFYAAMLTTTPKTKLKKNEIELYVTSPQFHERRRYVYAAHTDGSKASLRTLSSSVRKPNPYVETTLLYVLTLLRANRHVGDGKAPPLSGVRLELTLAADNGFYSQVRELQARELPITAASLASLPALLPPKADASGSIPKTGLGSSATLVTSLAGVLLHCYGVIHLPDGASDSVAGLDYLHSVAQLCHCAAQGKVGSGFDVSAATYGSQRYVRFSPSLIEEVLSLPDGAAPSPQALLASVGSVEEPVKWDNAVTPLALPEGIDVMMADVCCGANTPSMVKAITAWRKSDVGAEKLWRAYSAASSDLQRTLAQLCKLAQQLTSCGGWLESLTRCGCMDPAGWGDCGPVGLTLARIRETSLKLRGLVREISGAAGVPVEPPEQTLLLDATMHQRGVLMAVVPGAGGGDAVIALLLPSARAEGLLATRARVAALWRSWDVEVCELPVRESKAVAGYNGVRVEDESKADMLRAAVESGKRRSSMRRSIVMTPLDEEASLLSRIVAATLCVGAVAAAALAADAKRGGNLAKIFSERLPMDKARAILVSGRAMLESAAGALGGRLAPMVSMSAASPNLTPKP